MKLFVVICLCFYVLIPISRGQSHIFISPSGDDFTGNGTFEDPYATLPKAGDIAKPGDTVFVLPGTYYPESQEWIETIGTKDRPIVFTQYQNDSAVFNGSQTNLTKETQAILLFGHCRHVIVDGLEVQHSVGRGISVYESNNVTIKNCTVHDIEQRGIGGSGDNIVIENNECFRCAMKNKDQYYGNGGWPGVIQPTFFWSTGKFSRNWLIKDNHIHHSWGEGIIVASTNGCIVSGNTVEDVFSVCIYVDYSKNTVIENNYAFFNDDTYLRDGNRRTDAIKWAVEQTDDHTLDYGVDSLIITNNLIVGCRKAFSWYHEAPGGQQSKKYTYREVKIINNTTFNTEMALSLNELDPGARDVTGCVMLNNILDGYVENRGEVTFDYSHNCWIDGIPFSGDHIASFEGDPQFTSPEIDAPVSGFRITETSPCRNSGQSTEFARFDFWGTPRDEYTDIGFHEFNPATAIDPEQPALKGIILYPNPATSFIKITTTNKSRCGNFIIMNMLSIPVMKIRVNQTKKIDISGLKPGWYILVPENEKDMTFIPFLKL